VVERSLVAFSVIVRGGSRDYPSVETIRGLCRLAPVLAIGCFASLASAEPVALHFEAPAACPGESEFVAAVRERGGNFDGPEAEARAGRLDVKLTATADTFTGTLRVESRAGTSDVREVRDAACAEVVRGLAVVAAIALGADATNEHEPPATTTAAEPEAPPQRGAPAAERPRRLRGATFPAVDRVEVPAGTLHFDLQRAWSLMAGAEFGMFPGFVMPRFDFSGSLANFVTTPAGESHLVLPLVQLRGSLSTLGVRRFADYETRAVAFRIGMDICSLASYDSEGWVFMLCTEVGGGYASLRTRSLPGRPAYAQKKEGGFAYFGLAFDTRYNFNSLLHVGLRVGGTGQFGSVTAERQDGSQLFETHWLGGYAIAGFGIHF
jgi:hypothetical protein